MPVSTQLIDSTAFSRGGMPKGSTRYWWYPRVSWHRCGKPMGFLGKWSTNGGWTHIYVSLHGKSAVSVIVSQFFGNRVQDFCRNLIPHLYETHPIVWSKICDFTLNFLPWFPVFFCELGKGSINTVLLVKIEGPGYTIYHHVPIVKGVSSNPSIHQPTNGKRTSMGSIHAVKLTRSPKGLIGQGDLGLPAANRSKSPRDNPNAPVIHHKPEP